jgi:hypothetical protein
MNTFVLPVAQIVNTRHFPSAPSARKTTALPRLVIVIEIFYRAAFLGHQLLLGSIAVAVVVLVEDRG